MDVLSKLMIRVASICVLSPFTGIAPHQAVSIYADDVALFVKPRELDLNLVRSMLAVFGEAYGLRVNYHKSMAIMIHGDNADKDRVESVLQCRMGAFPCRYLGLQLAIRKLTRAEWQPMLDPTKNFAPA